MKKLFTFGLWLLVVGMAAQSTISKHFPPNHFLIYKTTDGLPGNIIYDIAIDKDGFVWVGTNNGLGRYDGQRFMAFKDLVGITDMPQSRIASIFADSHHSLWVRFNNQAIYCIDLKTYKVRFINTDYSEHNIDFKPNFVEDKAGNIWFNDLKSVVKWQWTDKEFIVYPFPEYLNKSIISICKGGEDYLWVATRGGIYRFDTQNHTYEREQHLLNFDEKVRALSTDDAGNLWFSNWYNMEAGVVCYDSKQHQILHKINKQMISPTANTDIYEIQPVGKMVWFGTNSSGLMAFDRENNSFNLYTPNSNNPLSIQSEKTFCIQNDKQGNLWIGTANGLHLLQAHPKEILLLGHHPFNPNSLISPFATSAYNLDERKIALGTLSGLSIYDRIDKSFKNIKLPQYNGNNYNNQINAFASGENGSFWVGTWSGLFRLDINTGSILEYYITFGNAGNNHPQAVMRPNVGAIKNLHKDKKGILWFINQQIQLGKMVGSSQTRTFELIKTMIPDGDKKNDAPNCFLESDAYLFIGTENGLVQYDYTNHTFQLLPITFNDNKDDVSIKNLEMSGGFLLATVNGKPYRINLAKGEAKPLVKSGNEQKYWRIMDAGEGGIWMDTENGLFRTDINGEASVFYDSKHYLTDNTFQQSDEYSIDKDADGNLYFGGSKGFTVIQPKEMLYYAPKPDVKITSIRFNNQPIELDEAIHIAQSIKLPYAQRSFSLEFSAIGSTIPELNQFAYRLDNDQWVNLGNQSNVNFSNLEPGTYHLQVKAANSDGIWNEEGTHLKITIRPPWYGSWLAWLAYLGAIGYGIYHFYLYQLRRRLEHAETDRLKELDTFKTRFFTNITHEFRTPLTVILGMTNQMMTGGKEVSESLKNKLKLIQQNGENLLRLINQILDLAQLDTHALSMNYIQGDVVTYLNYVSESLHSFANGNNVLIKVECKEPEIVMDYEPEHLRQITYNLLSNAIKFTPSGGKILLNMAITEGGKWLTLRFEDTGAGIPAEDLPYIFDRFFQSKNQDDVETKGSGIGLSLTKELVRIMGGDISVQSNSQGTVFTVKLPITHNAPLSDIENRHVVNEVNTVLNNHQVHLNNVTNNEVNDVEKPLLLVIEDNPDVVAYITSCLQHEYQLDFGYNGRVGIEKAFEILPDIILSDVMMPEKSGLEVLQTLKNDERTSHIPIVLLTAKATVEDRIKGLRIGADAYLVKPFYPEELFVVLSKLIDLRKVLQAKYANWVFDNKIKQSVAESETPLEDAFLQKIRVVIEKNMSNADFEMPQLERAIGMSRSQIFRKIKALTAQSPTHFIRSIRLQHGKHLLETTKLTVSEIAYDSGFSSIAYFSDAFLEAFKVRPSEWRK